MFSLFEEQNYRIIVGSFGHLPTTSYSPIIQQNTDIYLDKPQGSACTDNILLSSKAKTLNTGKTVSLYSFFKKLFCLVIRKIRHYS